MNFIEGFFGVVLGIYAALTVKKWSRSTKMERVFVVLSIISVLVIAYNAINKGRQEKALQDVYNNIGEFKNSRKVKFPAMSIGGAEGGMYNPWGGPTGFFSSDHKPIFAVYTQDNKLFVNAIVRDFDGKVIAVINDNEWKIFNKDDFEYNNDETGFEVVSNGDHKVYFQVYLEHDQANFCGLFVGEDKNGWFFFWDKKEKFGSSISIQNGLMWKDEDYMGYNSPIFRYPRERHLGERAPHPTWASRPLFDDKK